MSKLRPSGITIKYCSCLTEETTDWTYFKLEPVCEILTEQLHGVALLCVIYFEDDLFFGTQPQMQLSLLTRKSELSDQLRTSGAKTSSDLMSENEVCCVGLFLFLKASKI